MKQNETILNECINHRICNYIYLQCFTSVFLWKSLFMDIWLYMYCSNITTFSLWNIMLYKTKIGIQINHSNLRLGGKGFNLCTSSNYHVFKRWMGRCKAIITFFLLICLKKIHTPPFLSPTDRRNLTTTPEVVTDFFLLKKLIKVFLK